jgi:hypothetical protein
VYVDVAVAALGKRVGSCSSEHLPTLILWLQG